MSLPILTPISETPKSFTRIRVAGLLADTGTLSGGGLPDVQVVTLRTHDELLSFTPAEALALAAALEALAVHVLEETTDGRAA